MKYRIEIKLVGYTTVEVEASDEGAAEEAAVVKFWDTFDKAPAKYLEGKFVETTTLNCYE